MRLRVNCKIPHYGSETQRAKWSTCQTKVLRWCRFNRASDMATSGNACMIIADPYALKWAVRRTDASVEMKDNYVSDALPTENS